MIARIQQRKKRKAQLGDRKSAAAQSRMKTIATLAAEDAVGPAKKRKKGGEKDDGFGRDDSDWAVYREVVSRRLRHSLASLTVRAARKTLMQRKTTRLYFRPSKASCYSTTQSSAKMRRLRVVHTQRTLSSTPSSVEGKRASSTQKI